MAFQKAFTPLGVASFAIVYVLRRLFGALLPYWALPTLLCCVLLSLYTAIVAYTICVRPLLSPLRHLPTAPQPPIWQRLFKEPSAYHFEKWYREVPNNGLIKYYGILNLERVLVTSPAYIRQILQTDAYSYDKQYGQKTHLERVGGRGLVWQEGTMHKYLRRALEPSFKTSLVKGAYLSHITRKSEEMLRLVRDVLCMESVPSKATTNAEEEMSAVFGLDEIVHKTVFDIMGLVAFGPSMDFESIFRPELYYDPLQDYRYAFKPSKPNRVRVYAAFFLPTWVVNALPIRFNYTTAVAIQRFRQIGRDWIGREKLSMAEREKPSYDTESFIMEPILQKGRLSDKDLLEQFSMFQAGGIHSTGAAIMSTLWWLAHPTNIHAQRQLREEIRVNIPSADPRTWESPDVFESCHYLNAVISEVLRLHPPFSWLGRTPNRWTELGGTALSPGLAISISPWAAHRDSKIWGEDADFFRPERWLQSCTPSGMSSRQSKPALLTFGAGPRKCIAETLARMELHCVLAALFGQFEFEAVPGVELPSVTQQSTLAFRAELKLRTTLIGGWYDCTSNNGKEIRSK